MRRYYFDHNATTPVAGSVLQAMLPCLRENYGNASSIHSFGQDAKRLMEAARRQAAALLNAGPKEIVFTSGGTEADNLAIFGAVRAAKRSRAHVITSTIEHSAVLNSCQQLEKEGVEVTYVPAGAGGAVSPDDVRAALRPETVLISIMHANNETGVIQPIEEISRVAREAGVLLHSDGVQSTGKIPVDVHELGVDLFSLSAHKIYGPKGVGALYVRKGVELERIQFGGSHERGRRPGTENVAGIVGLGAAAELVRQGLKEESARMAALRDRLEQELLRRIPSAGVNGAGAPRTPNTANLYFDGVEGEPLVIALDLKGFAVSSGAACASGAVEPSHVLLAMGVPKERARSSLRFSLGRQNDEEQAGRLLETLPGVVERLRKLSPAYAD